MSEMRGGIADVKGLLQLRVDALVRHCAPEGKLQHGYWIARNPTRDDRNAGSFYVIVDRAGKTPGAWNDQATNDKGDILDLICYTQHLDRKAALAWAKDWLNFKQMKPTDITRARENAARTARQAEQIAAKQLAENQDRAGTVYRKSKLQKFRGTLADTYLLARGIDLGLLSRVPGALGYIPRMKHTETDTHWPVMVAGLSDVDGVTRAVHRTFLAEDGSGKAPVAPPRKIWPSFRGLAIRLWRGETNMSVAEACKHGMIDTLVIVEGVEDGLSVALARPDLRVWAAGSLGNIGAIQLPPCTGEVIVCADNDWGKPQAEAQLHAACQALARQGRPIKIARSPVGKDMNDCLRGAA